MDERTGLRDAAWDATSEEFLGEWNHLVSTTNWEKGRIILEWRAALVAEGASAADYSDETWSRQVGAVSPQHVGRLRRVADRFGPVREEYPGLYWSHFQAALDWDDAEMWLEGAVQNGWSVAQMRRQRWEALGAPASLKPRDEDVIAAEFDEDYSPAEGEIETVVFPTTETLGEMDELDGAVSREPSGRAEYEAGASESDEPTVDQPTAAATAVRPFEDLADLPDDLADAMEAFKLSILRHKTAGWTEVSAHDVLDCLAALRELVLAPAG